MNGIEIVRAMELKQEPPRKRTVLTLHGPISVSLPWVSTGGIFYRSRGSSIAGRMVFAYFHDRPLERIEDAEEVLFQAPLFFHSQPPLGNICCGNGYLDPKRTPAELLWMTQNSGSYLWSIERWKEGTAMINFLNLQQAFVRCNVFPWTGDPNERN